MSPWHADDDTELEPGQCALCPDRPPSEVLIAGPSPGERDFAIVRCTGCGLLYTDPRPTPRSLSRYYAADYYSYHFVGARPPSHRLKLRLWRALGLLPPRPRPEEDRALPRLVRRALTRRHGASAVWLLPAPHQGARYLDVGCGAGERLELARDLGWTTFGVDLGEAAVRAAANRGHRTAVANAARLPFTAASFDYLNLSHVLEHLHEPLELLRECRRVLRPDGVAQITVPNAASWGARRYGANWYPYEVPRHLYHFTAKTLGQLAQRAGLEVALVRTLPNEWALQESQRAAGEEVSAGRWPTFLGRRRARAGEGGNLDVWCCLG
jgi:SAM-dependent methyltransferase